MFAAWAVVARAQSVEPTSSGDLRWIGSTLTDFPVDAEGTTIGQAPWLDQRLRVGAGLRAEHASIGTEWDLLTGQLAGGTWQIPGGVDARLRDERAALTVDGFRPRRIAATATSGAWSFEGGLVTSSWGMGMVANDGATDPLFGRADFGDRVVRLRATHASERSTFLTGAVDWVVQDDIAALSDHQLAFQGLAAVLAVRAHSRAGLYFAARHQVEADRTRITQAGVLDGHVQGDRALGAWTGHAEAEIAGILGRTSRGTTYAARDMVGVEALGATGDLGVTRDPVSLDLRLGYASGDGDPSDGVNHDFTFDRDFGVGMVLFPEVTGAIEAASYALLTDPVHAGQPPDGVDAIVTEGSFRRAAFVQPVVRWEPDPVELRGGVVLAYSTAPFSEPFYTFRSGGYPTNQHGEPADGRLLGTEVDWAVGVHAGSSVRANVELQGGHAILGPPLRGDGPNVVHLVTLRGRVQW